MLLPALTERIQLTDGRGNIPCSPDYMAALNARNAIFRLTVEQPPSGHLRGEERRRWFQHNGLMDRSQWQGGHIGATVWFEPPGDVPLGWAILQKRDKRDDAGLLSKHDGRWHLDFYAAATGDNGENDRGFFYALKRVANGRKWFKEWADRREKPYDTQYLVLARYPVGKGEYPPVSAQAALR
ncbi:hypothetical protein [Sphingomonas immobilis]|uniref:Uncharacterized protein n=1 Tax=Sphingomonas immobilis TaxID=3063997 RepID=A0ABT8ZW49_9SPHN|nr:hypothetical protein [Sphingomonas sp. CA1-15]MDO7841796.1 hypothetical protein [Sphingomonas sp. CA1-15]